MLVAAEDEINLAQEGEAVFLFPSILVPARSLWGG